MKTIKIIETNVSTDKVFDVNSYQKEGIIYFNIADNMLYVKQIGLNCVLCLGAISTYNLNENENNAPINPGLISENFALKVIALSANLADIKDLIK